VQSCQLQGRGDRIGIGLDWIVTRDFAKGLALLLSSRQ
jgi:hypothetical protein